MKTIRPALATLSLLTLLLPLDGAADQARQDDVRERSADVMPFDMGATTHVFTKTPTGGLQSVIAKDPRDESQVRLIRAHLKDLTDKFNRRDFSGPTHVHGPSMPGLAELRAATAEQLQTRYRDIAAGAEVQYSSSSPEIITAVHRWLYAQLADHGADAVSGHDHSIHHPN